MLDPVEPRHFDIVFDTVPAAREQSGGLGAFRRLGGHVLIALDGTEYFRSDKLSCPSYQATCRNNCVTDLPVNAGNVAELAAAGRARRKIENESFNTLKTKGCNLAHNFGHGRQNLAAVLATLNLLAFASHTVAELADEVWRKAIEHIGARSHLFWHLRAITAYLVLPSWQNLLQILARLIPAGQPPRPARQNENCWFGCSPCVLRHRVQGIIVHVGVEPRSWYKLAVRVSISPEVR